MSPLPPDLIKIRNELVEEHKLLTKDNGIESSSYHFKAGFNACAEIFLKRERDNQKVFFDEIQWMELNKLQARVLRLTEVLYDAKNTIIAMYDCNEIWSLEQERIGNRAIGIVCVKKIEEALAEEEQGK